MAPDQAPGLIQQYAPNAVELGAIFFMLKFLVTDKLKRIDGALGSHEKRLRRQETQNAALHGALRAKGCILGDSCPMAVAEDDEEAV